MPVCHERKFIFLHIPRCAGTSLELYFDLVRPENLFGVGHVGNEVLTFQHLTLAEIRRRNILNAEQIDSYFKFTIIRDPFDRLASDFLWQKNHDPTGRFKRMNFEEFMSFAHDVIEQNRYFDEVHLDHFRPMFDYCIEGDELAVDEILLLDQLTQECERLKPKLGEIDLRRYNASESSYHALRTPSNLALVDSLYAADRYLFDILSSERSGAGEAADQ